MSAIMPAILCTRGNEYRIALCEGFDSRNWTPDGAWGSWNLTGTFDASQVYPGLIAARDGLATLRKERAKEMGDHAVFATKSYGYHLISIDKPFAEIRRDGLAWAARQAQLNREQDHLQPA